MQNVTTLNAGKTVTVNAGTLFEFTTSAGNIANMMSQCDDKQALDLLNTIPPVQRAWVYRVLGA